MPINIDQYKNVLKIKEVSELGGQELIYGEIVGACLGYQNIYLPMICSTLLQITFIEKGHKLFHGDGIYASLPEADVMYFGTPTIVKDKALFYPERFPLWNKDYERSFVKMICKKAVKAGFSKIISGLGSGDISVRERLNDMGGGKVICYKDFGDFEDWVLERKI